MSAQVIKLGEGYFFLKINNFLKLNEINEVWDEINFLTFRSKLKKNTNTAETENGELLSNKNGVFLDDIYSERKFCNFFKYYKKWNNEQTKINLLKTSLFWRNLFVSQFDSTLLSYYEDGSYYKQHTDESRFTQLFWTFKQPKKFSGGELVFTDFNYQLETENNTLILFPSWFAHRVEPVVLNEKTPEDQDKFLCNGRYVFTTFYN